MIIFWWYLKLRLRNNFTLCNLLHELGRPVNSDTFPPPTKHHAGLGIDIGINTKTISITKEKHLLGKLLYIQKCVKPSHIFVNRISASFRNDSHSTKIYLTPDFHKDIQWFLTFVPSYNGITFIRKNSVDPIQSLYLYVCLTESCLADLVYVPPFKILGFEP